MVETIPAPFDAYLNTPNKSVRLNVPRKGVCLHHGALRSLDELRRLCMGAKQVSATAIAKDSHSEELMRDEYRAWSLSSAWGDSSFRSVETCNETIEGWTISDESHWELARLVAYWAQRDGFWPHRDGDPKTWTVLGHREVYTIYGVSYATACPGGMDLDLVTARAQQLLREAADGGTVPPPPYREDEEMPVIALENIRGNSSPAAGWTSFTAAPGKLVCHPLVRPRTSESKTGNAVSDMALYAIQQPTLRFMNDYDFIAYLVSLGFEDVPRMVGPTDDVGARKMRAWLPKPGQTAEFTSEGTVLIGKAAA